MFFWAKEILKFVKTIPEVKMCCKKNESTYYLHPLPYGRNIAQYNDGIQIFQVIPGRTAGILHWYLLVEYMD